MEWVDRLNAAIEYMEAHMCGDMDPAAIERIMACPYGVFQRSFMQIAGIPVSEYMRRRRLSCAAYDICNTKKRIIDIAQQYKYESADAFGAAFKQLHGIAPSAVRKMTKPLKFYTRLTFTLAIKGVYEMDYKVVERKPFKVIGRKRVTLEGGGTWGIAKTDGSIEQMQALAGTPDVVLLGVCFGFGEDGSNDYMVGMVYEGADEEGLESYTYPAATWLEFTAEGAVSDNVLGNLWQRIYGEFLPQSEYKQSVLPTVEAYIAWDNDKDYCKMAVWIPVE